MCGITGYLGNKNAVAVITHGLRNLEYRGYDSAGIALVNKGKIDLIKRKGKLDILEAEISSISKAYSNAIGHTRWATHGEPSEINAHPHIDCNGSIAVVHNGIIENYRELRDELITAGHSFRSDTDSEVIAHLIEESYENDLRAAVEKAISRLRGAWAIVACCSMQPDVLVGARFDSPLVVGVSSDEIFFASALPAFLAFSRKVVFPENGDIIEARANGSYTIYDSEGTVTEREVVTVSFDADTAMKGGYEDYMLKEIHEQPEAWNETLRDKFIQGCRVVLDDAGFAEEYIKDINRINLVSCGTSYHAGLLGRYIFERWMDIPVEVDIASEFRYRKPIVDEKTLIVAISQSGETADTLAALRMARSRGARIISVVNVVGSQMTRESDDVFYTHAGLEIGVAATKTFISQLAAVYLLGIFFKSETEQFCRAENEAIIDDLQSMPDFIRKAIDMEDQTRDIARRYYHYNDFLYIGRNLNYPIAMEGALKLKEISYIHAEAYPAGEMKHGPIALLSPEFPVIAIAPKDELYDKMMNNMEEIKARNAPIIAIVDERDNTAEAVADEVIKLPALPDYLFPVVATPILQLLAYHIAKLRGCNVDQPRNLAKTVVVE